MQHECPGAGTRSSTTYVVNFVCSLSRRKFRGRTWYHGVPYNRRCQHEPRVAMRPTVCKSFFRYACACILGPVSTWSIRAKHPSNNKVKKINISDRMNRLDRTVRLKRFLLTNKLFLVFCSSAKTLNWNESPVKEKKDTHRSRWRSTQSMLSVKYKGE